MDNISYKQKTQIKNQNNLWEWWHEDRGFRKFIDFIELDLSQPKADESTYNIVTPQRCELETYWQYKNNKLYFMIKIKE